MNLRYSVVFERTPNNYCAYVPDLPGCIATARTWEGIQDEIREAIAFHIEGLLGDGDSMPEPQLSVAGAATFHNENTISAANSSETAEMFAVVAIEAQIGAEPVLATDG